MTFGRFVTFNVTVPDVGDALTMQDASSVTFRGVEWTFESPVPVGVGADGVPVVDTTNGVTITNITPAAAVQNGAWANGFVLAPYGGNNQLPQGFDAFIGEDNGSGAGQVAYDHTLNRDPGATGGDLVIAPGTRTVGWKALRRSGVTIAAWAQCEDYVPIAFMPAAETRAGMFTPGASYPDQTIFTDADIDLSVLQSLAPPFGASTLLDILNIDAPTWPFCGYGGEDLRRFEGVQYSLANSGYSGDLGQWRALLGYGLHYNASDANKLPLARAIIRHGLDIDAAHQAGWNGAAGAGQWHGYHTAHFMTAFLLQDSAMLARAQTLRSNMRDHPAWIVAGDEGLGVGFPGPTGQQARYRHTFYATDIGKPFWTEKFRGSQPTSRYLTLSLPVGIIEAFPVFLLQNGPGGVSGIDAFLDGPNDTTNDRAAMLAIYDRLKTWKNRERGFTYTGAPYEDFFEAWRGNIPEWGWAGTPDVIEAYQAADQNFVTAIDGGVAWDISGYDFGGNQPVTDIHVRWSTDQRGWTEVSGQPEVGQLTGLPRGTDVYVQIAKSNASGKGRFSVNFDFSDEPYAFSEGPRNVVQPTGSEANAAPVNSVVPEIVERTYPAWRGPEYAPVSGTLDVNTIELSVAVNAWSGFPFPTFAFQWLRNGAPIAGATAQDYVRTADDAGATLTCEVTATNGSGSTTVTTPVGVTCPAINTPPAGTLIDTDFRGAFAIDYASVLSNIGSYNATPVHRPTEAFGGLAGTNFGAMQCDKDGSYATIRLRVGTALAGVTYRVQAQVVTTEDHAGNVRFLVQDQAGPSTIQAGLDAPMSADQVEDIDFTFQIATDTPIFATLNHNTGAGGGGGGSPYLTRLRIVAE